MDHADDFHEPDFHGEVGAFLPGGGEPRPKPDGAPPSGPAPCVKPAAWGPAARACCCLSALTLGLVIVVAMAALGLVPPLRPILGVFSEEEYGGLRGVSRPAVPPAPVRLAGWSGHLGVDLCQIGHALAFAGLAGYSQVRLPPRGGEAERTGAGLRPDILLDLPGELRVPPGPAGGGGRPQVPDRCAGASAYHQADGTYMGDWLDRPCRGVTAEDYHGLLLKHVRPLVSPRLAVCLAAGGPVDPGLLTVHLPGGDQWPAAVTRSSRRLGGAEEAAALRSAWREPPCSMYEKIIVEVGFQRVLAVAGADRRHPCIDWLLALAKRRPVAVEVRTGSPLEVSCALLRARDVVLSHSALSESLALLSNTVRRIYSREAYTPYSMMDCKGWPGVAVNHFYVPVTETSHDPYHDTWNGVQEWMLTYPKEKVVGPSSCDESPDG